MGAGRHQWNARAGARDHRRRFRSRGRDIRETRPANRVGRTGAIIAALHEVCRLAVRHEDGLESRAVPDERESARRFGERQDVAADRGEIDGARRQKLGGALPGLPDQAPVDVVHGGHLSSQ